MESSRYAPSSPMCRASRYTTLIQRWRPAARNAIVRAERKPLERWTEPLPRKKQKHLPLNFSLTCQLITFPIHFLMNFQ